MLVFVPLPQHDVRPVWAEAGGQSGQASGVKSPGKSRLGEAALGLPPGGEAAVQGQLRRAGGRQEDQLNVRESLSHGASDQTVQRAMS